MKVWQNDDGVEWAARGSGERWAIDHDAGAGLAIAQTEEIVWLRKNRTNQQVTQIKCRWVL